MELLLLFLLASISGELPEPTLDNIQYEAEVGFGTFTGIVWQPIPITYQVVAGQPSGEHKYWSTLGVQRFEATACNDPNKKVIFEFNIDSISAPLVFYRVRLRGYIGDIKGEWSEPSYWVGLINIDSPSRPIH